MDLAHLGIVVDAEGARRELKLTSEQMKILADGGSAATAMLKGLTGGMTEEAAAAEKAAASTAKLEASFVRMGKAAANRRDVWMSAQIGELDPFQSGNFSKGAKQAAEDHKTVAAAAERHKLSLGRLGNSIADLGARLTGVHPILGKLVEIMGSFAVGSVVAIGVIAGITAIAFAWDKFTESVRKATAEQDALVKSGLEALRTKALGAGGEFANTATAAAGRISDLEQTRRDAQTLMGRDLRPSVQRERLHQIDAEIAQLRLLVKNAEAQVEVARTRQFADSITQPFDYAVTRGQDILHFYDEAAIAQTRLNALAKSGTFEIRAAAIQGLQQINAILDRMKLQRMGLAEGPSRVLGLPSDIALPGLRNTGGILGGAIANVSRTGGSIVDVDAQVQRFLQTTSRALNEQEGDWTAVKQAIKEAADQAQLYADAVILSQGGGEKYAARIRNRQSDNGALAAAQAQTKYGQDLSAREAALKMPRVFDAVREAALALAEGLRTSRQRIDVGVENWKPKNIVGGIKGGLEQAGADFLTQFSPQGIAMSLANKGISFLTEGLTEMVGGLFDGGRAAREYAKEMRKLRTDFEAAAASFRHDDLASALLQNTQNADALRDMAEKLFGSLLAVLKDKGAGYKQAIADIAAQEAKNAERLRAEAEQTKRYAREDLEVRLLRARGRDDEADALAYAQEQQRQYAQAVKDGADATYLAMLTEVQAAEKIARAMGILDTATKNAPAGYKVEGYIYDYAAARQQSGGLTPKMPTPITVNMPPGSVLIVDGRKTPVEQARDMVAGLRQIAASYTGTNGTLAGTMELVS